MSAGRSLLNRLIGTELSGPVIAGQPTHITHPKVENFHVHLTLAFFAFPRVAQAKKEFLLLFGGSYENTLNFPVKPFTSIELGGRMCTSPPKIADDGNKCSLLRLQGERQEPSCQH